MSDTTKPKPPDYPGFILDWKSVRWLAFNGQPRILMPQAADDPAVGHEAICYFFWDGLCWTFILIQAKFNTKFDVSHIAKDLGGSGTKEKSTFTCATIPFPLYKFK